MADRCFPVGVPQRGDFVRRSFAFAPVLPTASTFLETGSKQESGWSGAEHPQGRRKTWKESETEPEADEPDSGWRQS